MIGQKTETSFIVIRHQQKGLPCKNTTSLFIIMNHVHISFLYKQIFATFLTKHYHRMFTSVSNNHYHHIVKAALKEKPNLLNTSTMPSP